MTITETIIVSLLSGFASSFISILFSLKQFSLKKWWEKKSDEYLRIIKELVELQNCTYKWNDYYLDIFSMKQFSSSNKEKLSDSEISEMVKENKKLNESLRKIVITGSIVISQETTNELENLLNKINGLDELGIEDPINATKHEYDLIKKTIENIRQYAKKDLKVKN